MKTVPVAIVRSDGGVSIMHVVEEGRFSAASAERAGFALVEGDTYRREVTDAVIEAEIGAMPHESWRRISLADLPQERASRDRWKADFSLKDLPSAPARAESLRDELNRLKAVLIAKRIVTDAEIRR